MAITGYAYPAGLPATSAVVIAATAPRVFRRSLLGDAVLIAFLLTQCFDGVFTYVGVTTYGLAIEANPLISGLMAVFGHGLALTLAKGLAAALGICLHLRQVHSAVALLAAFYISIAIVPWMLILFA